MQEWVNSITTEEHLHNRIFELEFYLFHKCLPFVMENTDITIEDYTKYFSKPDGSPITVVDLIKKAIGAIGD